MELCNAIRIVGSACCCVVIAEYIKVWQRIAGGSDLSIITRIRILYGYVQTNDLYCLYVYLMTHYIPVNLHHVQIDWRWRSASVGCVAVGSCPARTYPSQRHPTSSNFPSRHCRCHQWCSYPAAPSQSNRLVIDCV